MSRKEEPMIIDEDVDLDDEVVTVDGKRLTNADADALADEAARVSRERSNANLIPGRKSLSGEGQHSPTVQTRVPQWVKDELVAEAAELGLARGNSAGDGKLVQRILTEYAERRREAG
ncbi:DNA-binding protein [Mycobacteroides salmoniphilum]|uniref:DNA-binding protein n=1 Tax=Mycobacteroides salmoniphilum TaxID=404941 RepID=UPI003567AAE1